MTNGEDIMFELLVATKNRGKLEEIKKIFENSSLDIKLQFLPDFGITADCPENGLTFFENATAKSLFYGSYVPELYTVGDDSGLSVDALNGAPGVFSSRFAGEDATDDRNTEKLLTKLQGKKNRKAKFVTALTLTRDGQIIAIFNGEVEGEIIDERRGSHGFGYDPVFYYPPLEKTFAELNTEEKNKISHRARAFKQLKEYLENESTKQGKK
jgi:XTP/dITP diphosphohydrolase